MGLVQNLLAETAGPKATVTVKKGNSKNWKKREKMSEANKKYDTYISGGPTKCPKSDSIERGKCCRTKYTPKRLLHFLWTNEQTLKAFSKKYYGNWYV